jgi:hypothetical protein
LREVLDASLRGECPYGDPPRVESADGDEITLERRNWSIDGEPVASVMPPYKCGWIVSTPSYCDDCELNPFNKPTPSPPLAHLFYLESLITAGATFHYSDLVDREWRGLLMLKAERNRRQIAELNKK